MTQEAKRLSPPHGHFSSPSLCCLGKSSPQQFTAFFVMHVQVSTCFFSLIKACTEALLIHCLHTNFCLMKVSTRFLSASPPILLGCCSYFGFPKLLLQKMGLLDMCLFHCVHFSRLSTVLQLLPLHVGTVAFLVATSNSEHHNGFI